MSPEWTKPKTNIMNTKETNRLVTTKSPHEFLKEEYTDEQLNEIEKYKEYLERELKNPVLKASDLFYSSSHSPEVKDRVKIEFDNWDVFGAFEVIVREWADNKDLEDIASFLEDRRFES